MLRFKSLMKVRHPIPQKKQTNKQKVHNQNKLVPFSEGSPTSWRTSDRERLKEDGQRDPDKSKVEAPDHICPQAHSGSLYNASEEFKPMFKIRTFHRNLNFELPLGEKLRSYATAGPVSYIPIVGQSGAVLPVCSSSPKSPLHCP